MMISLCCAVARIGFNEVFIFSNSFDVSFLTAGQLARCKCWVLHGLRFAQYLVPDPAMLFGYDVVWNFAICVISQPSPSFAT